MASDISINTEHELMNNLLTSSGMKGMLSTIWLVICAMSFGGAMQEGGLLKRISDPIISYAQKPGSLIATTSGTCIFFNLTTSDQYLSIVVPGRMFEESYKNKGLSPENLSRTLEDSGTVTSVLIPWNTCGATQSAVLGVATLSYLPYCFFNLISPIMTILYGYLQIKIKKSN
jgi:NhaC family Na+:H+ antiporter